MRPPAEVSGTGGEGNAGDLVTKLDGIIVNEAQLSVTVTEDESGGKRREAHRSATQEALRAEIAKDAGALLALEAVHPFLAERRVSTERLAALQAAAAELAGKLADRATAKGAGKSATQAEREAATLQRQTWGGAYRLLAALGQRDARVRALLAEAADTK